MIKKVLLGFVLSVFLLSTMACSLTDKLTSLTGPKMGKEVFTSEEGGFSYQVPADFESSESDGSVTMIAPDGDELYGPLIGLESTEIAGESLQDLLEYRESSIDTYTFSDPKNVKVDGKAGLQVTFSGEFEDEEIEGIMVVVKVSSSQSFVLIGGGPKDLSQDTLKAFPKVLKSIKFLD